MFLYVVAAILTCVVYYKYIRSSSQDYETLSKFYVDKCWCKGEEVVDTSIRPFKVDISDEQLEDLKKRIDATRYPAPALEDAKFTYGVNSDFMREFVDYWRNSYSWREQEKEINKFEHFKTKIEGLDIHFVHVKPKSSPANQSRPLLLCHGWPGSFIEFYKIIPMLTDPSSHGGNETDLFEVIVPSIPGYGFSQAAERQGLNTLHISRIFHKLMLRLGHKKYFLQGGDWGSLICARMSMLYPNAVRGVHFNMAIGNNDLLTASKLFLGSFAPNLFFEPDDANKMFPLKKMFKMLLVETGYVHIQATKPDTLGFALTDSPVGLAAYILEKFSTWTDMGGREKSDGGISQYWTKDEILSNIMIYWWSGNITSSMRLYKEAILDNRVTGSVKVRVPAGYAWFPNEIAGIPRSSIESKFTRLVSFTYMKEGGHFAAYQVPHLLAEDFRHFVRIIERVKQKEEMDESEYAKEFHQTHLDRYETN